MFLGIDQSYTNTGFCLIDSSQQLVDFGTIKTSDNQGDHFDRCNVIASTIVNYATLHKPVNIALEGLAFGMRGDATRDLAGLLFVIITQLRSQGFTPHLITPLSLKKFATGSGKADKALMISTLPTNVLTRFTSSNFKKTTGLADLADAYFIAKYASTINSIK
jgi:Holliday junction resolvasome RuvABC endonuclease subunit